MKGDKKVDKYKADTMTHKKGDKTGDKERMKGDKADTVTNKKGDTVTNKKGDQGRQAGRKADTLSGSKADTPLTVTCLGKCTRRTQ